MARVTIDEQIECVNRELVFRRRVYARHVHEGRMSPEKADKEITRMEAVLETLREIQKTELLL